jgi:hypothetical protein
MANIFALSDTRDVFVSDLFTDFNEFEVDYSGLYQDALNKTDSDVFNDFLKESLNEYINKKEYVKSMEFNWHYDTRPFDIYKPTPTDFQIEVVSSFSEIRRYGILSEDVDNDHYQSVVNNTYNTADIDYYYYESGHPAPDTLYPDDRDNIIAMKEQLLYELIANNFDIIDEYGIR